MRSLVLYEVAASLAATLLTGCPAMGIKDMTPEQLRATQGMVTCSQVNSTYGKGSAIIANADDLRKGGTSKGKTVITCGDASMTIETDVGVAQPVPAVAPIK